MFRSPECWPRAQWARPTKSAATRRQRVRRRIVASWLGCFRTRGLRGRSNGLWSVFQGKLGRRTAVPVRFLTSNAAEIATGIPSKQDLDDARDEFFRGENREQERREGSRGGGGQTGDVLESEGNRTHFADNVIAIAEIGERLDIGTPEDFLGRGGIADPFLLEALDVALSQQAVLGQSIPLCASHPGSKHQERAEEDQHEKGHKAASL